MWEFKASAARSFEISISKERMRTTVTQLQETFWKQVRDAQVPKWEDAMLAHNLAWEDKKTAVSFDKNSESSNSEAPMHG